jgi:pyruvate,water dikinase
MGRMLNRLKQLFSRGRRLDEAEVEPLRIEFKSRYHHFKLLLSANNQSLDIMAEIDEALTGKKPFGMKFVRARCTRISTHVFQIIQHLNRLAPGSYEPLQDRFREIQKCIHPFLEAPAPPSQGPLVLPLEAMDRNRVDQVGEKMANLGEILNRIHLRTPAGFAVTAEGYRRFLRHNDLQSEIDRRIQAEDTERLDSLHGLSASLQQLIIRAEVPEDLRQAVQEQVHRLEVEEGGPVTVAVRSSALGEDIAGTSFAGQYRSLLNVSGESLLAAYKEVVASKYSLQAMTYRLNRGIRDEDVDMCAGFLRMVRAVSSGVLYSRNPVDFRDDSVIINSTWGLPKTVVDGSAPADLFVLRRGDPPEILRRHIPRKEHKLVCYPEEGIGRQDLGEEEGVRPSLLEEQARELARLAVRLEEHYQTPQDIEWAIEEDGSIVLLQCRPLYAPEHGGGGRDTAGEASAPDSVLLQGGVTASPGAAAGPVFVVRKDMDTLQFPEGAVLVAAQALPRWAPALSRAAAVVTEQGGVAGHLASVAREFGIPALFGLGEATGRLQQGQWVTVDADGQRVHQGRMEALVRATGVRKSLMEGSPVFEALKGAARNITPLNLLDPDAPGFKPQNCRTFHDITRFCHEKSVQEMFRFGKDHHFPERSSKQLFCEVPMQWWVLNLDDGFLEEVSGKYVKVENILSIPMRALWDGITAVPWEGPPPIDGKGFMSVMYEATRNTALTTGVASRYANRNYFMISKNFCNLTSRLGFHFSTVEALVSDRASENYVSFQFKGGAADFERRLRRVLFVQEILETSDFRVEIKEDTLIARLEGMERSFMENRLKVLGYLTIHTRQLDMIMSNEASLNRCRTKIQRDLQEIVSQGPNL